MREDAKSFLVYDDIEAVLDELTDEQVGKLFRGMVSYHSSGDDPEFTGILKYVFIPIRQTMDRNAEKYRTICEKNRENGRLGGRQTNRTQANGSDRNQPKAIKANTDSDSDTYNNSDSDTESSELDVWSLSLSVLSHLNESAGTSYRTDKAEYVKLISELAHKGYTADQMRSVIDKKCADWLGDAKFEQYLRPSTLFGPKFEQYLNQPDSAGKKARDEAKDRKKKQAEARKQLQEKTEELKRLGEEYEEAYGDMPRRIDLRGKMAVIEAQMEALRVRAG